MKRSILKLFSLMLVIVMLTAVFAACGPKDDGSSDPPPSTPGDSSDSSSGGYDGPVMKVRVGVMCPLTGTNSRMGIREEASISAAEAHIKEDNFLNEAYELEIKRPFVDDENTTDRAPVAANLSLSENPHVVIGHHLTTMILISGPLFEEAQIPLIGMVSGPASVSQGWEYFHIGTVTDADAATVLADYFVKVKNLNDFYVMARNDEGGMAGAEAVIAALGEYDIEVLGYDQFATEDVDFTTFALTAKELGAKAILTYGLSATTQAVTCYDQIEQLYAPIPEEVYFAGSTSFAQADMATAFTGDKLAGIVFPTGYVPNPDDSFKVRFADTFKANDPDSMWPGDNDARVYDAVWNIAAALNDMVAAEGVVDVEDPEFSVKLNYYISQLKRDGVQGEINYKHFTDLAAENNTFDGRILVTGNVGEWQADGTQLQVYP